MIDVIAVIAGIYLCTRAMPRWLNWAQPVVVMLAGCGASVVAHALWRLL